MKGDPGPYMEMDGPTIYVPRTVPYLKARRLARSGMEYGQLDHRLGYVGKREARLLGFTRDCFCEEVCSARPLCPKVPVWQFEDRDRYGD